MITGRVPTVASLAFLAVLPACALLTKSAPMEPRYFSPEMGATNRVGSSPPSALELRLGHVNAGADLKDRMVRRDSTYEVVYYDERLWTEKPETYVRRALAQAIFDDRGVRQVLSGVATTLDVDVLAFEEVTKPVHVARVQLSYVLYDERLVRLSRSVAVERPVGDAKGDAAADAVVEALASAMSAAVDAVAIATTTELHTEASAEATAR